MQKAKQTPRQFAMRSERTPIHTINPKTMPNAIHISTARIMLNRPEPIDIKLWTRSGEIQTWKRCITIKYDHYKGTRKIKLLDSNQIRQLRECCIFEINGMQVFL